VVSGGGRGITAEALIALARRTELRLLVLGRTPLADEPDTLRGVADVADLTRLVLQDARARGGAASPGEVRAAVARIIAAREIRDTLARLRAAGSEVRYSLTDVADAHAVAGALEAARRDWGPIAGVIHGAGALADARLRDKTESHAERVFGPKLRGLANLLAATAADPLRLICTFSSVAAHAGNAGQADYAMANGILERVTAAEGARRGPSCLVRALAWGPWDRGMVTEHLREKFARDGVSLIDPPAGSAAFVRELGDRGAGTTVLLTADPPDRHRSMTAPEGELVVPVTPALYPQLADHRIGDRLVLPMAMAVEWLARLLRLLEPTASRLRLDHLQVLRPIVVADRGAPPTRLTLRYRREADGRAVRVRICGSDGAACYGGAIVLPADNRAAPMAPLAPDGAGPFPVSEEAGRAPARLYGDGVLFHGPRFQMLREVYAVAPTFARARMATTGAMGWPGAFLAEPALVDGALQLALVWAFEATRQPYLPMRLGAVDVALDARPATVVTATLVAPPISGATLRASVRVADETGAVLVDLRDVEGHPVPGGRSTRLPPAVGSEVVS
jgi:Polyketide synthase dehydratase/KR domain